jgi:hypothetical protein
MVLPDPLSKAAARHGERVEVWQCIGCGKIEAPQPCIGVCRDRRTEFVYGEDYDALAAHAEALAAIVRQIATVTPREGEWERSYKALQTRAREALEKLADTNVAARA